MDQLMMHSFEVESIEKRGEGLEKVVVGKILEISKHPNADRLQLTKVDIGAMKLDIVCGAPNIKVEDKVPVAIIGAKLPNGLEIKETEIRGVKSFGMLCAEDELGLGKDHGGILILDKSAKIGEKITKTLGLDDSIFEIKVLPDRGHDALCHIGVAREVAALNGKKIDPYFKKIKLNKKKAASLRIKIEDKKLCPRYIGAVMDNIKIQQSPAWIKNRLSLVGINPVNNIVDATNYVMLELGQPMHAFDCNKIGNGKSANIIVRRAKNDEKIVLLDGTEKNLNENDLIISNEEKALAIAGVMGGEDSGINDDTNTIVLESANFNATSIRKTRTRLNIKTEASDRYEKDIDPNLAEIAMARIIEIIEMTGGKFRELIDIYPKPIKEWKIKLNSEYAVRLLGEKIPITTMIKILESLEIRAKSKGKIIEATIPTFRIDLKTQEDLVEEIGRINGYEKIRSEAPIYPVQPAKINKQRSFERIIKDFLVGAGFSEVHNYSFYNKQDASQAGFSQKHLELENPINPDQALMRVSLIPGLIKNIRENLKNFKEIEIFEIGRVYIPNNSVLPEEKNMLLGAVVVDESKKGNNFYEAKGYVELIFKKLGITSYNFIGSVSSELWHKTRYADIKASGKEENIGCLGEINPLVLKKFDIEKRVVMFEFDLKKLQEISKIEKEFVPLRKYPVSTRDISLITGSETKTLDILENIKNSGGDLVLEAELFDVFDFKEKETSFAFRISFGSDDRTLRNEEIDEAMKKIIENLEKELKVKVRK